MKKLIKSVPVQRITPVDGGQYYFGYYDIQPYSADESLHLTHKADFRDRLQIRGDSVEVGFIDMSNGRYEKLDTTFAWNFQQGAMLQWNPQKADREVIYNAIIDGEHHGVVMDIHSGKKRFLDRPVANVSRDGKYALSINMSRLYNFRPGYGYAWPGDKFFFENHSKDDGAFLLDMETGKSKLVLSLDEIWDFSGSYFAKDEKMIINHITFNPSASRFLMLVRNFPPKGGKHVTSIITANRDGSDMFLLSDYGVQSHYWWINDEEVVFFSDGKELACARGPYNNYVFKDKTHEGYMQADGYFDDDNHMIFSPDGKIMLADSYANATGHRRLCLYSPSKNICTDIGYFHSLPCGDSDIRCDLHPRWNRSGNGITFDATHEGFRGIYKIDLPEKVIADLFEE